MPDAALPAYTVGIVAGASEHEACLCVLGHGEQSLISWSLHATGLPLRQDAIETGRCGAIDQSSLEPILHHLEHTIPEGAEVGVLVEAEALYPDRDQGGTPAGVFPWASAPLGVVLALATQRSGLRLCLGCFEVPEKAVMVIHYASGVGDGSASQPTIAQPRLLSRGLLTACTSLLADAPPTPGRRAVVAAMLARNPGAYAYWSTFDSPPSMGDVVHHLRVGQTRMLVGSPSAQFSMRIRSRADSALDIALSYASSAQEHHHLGPNDQHKVALLHLCKDFDFDLRCVASRIDVRAVDPRRVWPWPAEDAWLLKRLREPEA
jgi:hypothetical protein